MIFSDTCMQCLPALFASADRLDFLAKFTLALTLRLAKLPVSIAETTSGSVVGGGGDCSSQVFWYLD